MPLKNDTHPELLAKSAVVTQAYTDEMYARLIALIPTPDLVQANHSGYAASYTASLAGNADKAAECEQYHASVYEGLSILLGLVKAVTIKDPKMSKALGVDYATRTPSTDIMLAKPTGFKVFYDPAGNIIGTVTKVDYARLYQVWCCDSNPSIESNWRPLTSTLVGRRFELPGIDRAKNNWLKIRAQRGNGDVGPWSNIVNLPPK